MEQVAQRAQDVEATRKRRRKRRRRCKRHPEEGPHSPTCRGNKETNAANYSHLVRVLPTLQPVLDFLEVKGDIFTRAQIMGHLIEYIKKKALYDPADPRKVYCENDQLGQIFGCKEFSTANACELLLQNLETASPASTSMEPLEKMTKYNTTGLFRRPNCASTTTDTCSCSESDQQSANDLSCSSSRSMASTSGRKQTYNTAFPVDLTHQFPGTSSSLSCEASTSQAAYALKPQNLFDYQGHATEVVTDTSDDLFFLNETDEERVVKQEDSDAYVGEYEPISYSEEEQLIQAYGFEAGEEDSTDTQVDEGEDGGDELGNSDSSDSEIEEEDKWQCDSCRQRNHPMTRRCRQCWSVRKDWYSISLDRTSSDPGQIKTEHAEMDPATVSDTASTSRAGLPLVPPQVIAGEDTAASDSHATSETCDEFGARVKCMLCRKEPPNGCIVHGSTGHQVCCVTCAQKLKEDNKPCPVCRKRIGKVIKNFM